MPKEDWLQKEIRKLALVLAKLMKLKLMGNHAEIIAEAHNSLNGLPGLDDEGLSSQELADKLISHCEDASQAKILSDIFREKALAQEITGDNIGALYSFEIAVVLAKWADVKEAVFSFENMGNIAFLEDKIAGLSED